MGFIIYTVLELPSVTFCVKYYFHKYNFRSV